MYAQVLTTQKFGKDQETLTYHIPTDMILEPGDLVEISLRKNTIFGIVWEVNNQKPAFRTLGINKKVSSNLLSKQQIALIKWMKESYFCPLHKILKLFVTKRVLTDRKLPKPKKTEQIIRTNSKKLNEEQEKLVQKIENGDQNKFLIHGITGSGKTEVYLKLAEKIIQKNEQVLILVPEISLTPQVIEYFEKGLGLHPSVINSKLSDSEKQTSWLKIKSNEAKLIIGSRSAIFAPFSNLGMIIIDEEHESSYKQDTAPRYHTHDLAEKIQELNPSIKLIFGSATPSIETAEKLKDSTLSLSKRIGTSTLPEIEIIDLREEFKKNNYSIFSERLKEEIQNALEKKEQIILFLNRRGDSSSVVCRDCGYICKCEDCDSPMTYHTKTLQETKLICHHCGTLAKPPNTCPTCQGTNIRFLGIGTQKIEAELLKEFPTARVLRADKDTTATKNGFKDIYHKFRNHEADILIGTQMIAKGLHLPKVNLVGVVLADIGLNIPDFKTTERNFQLLTQVSGRAGRDSSDGKVIIQTYNPENISLICAQAHDYNKFFNYERTQRKILANPPFGQIAKILIQNKSLQKCKTENDKIFNLLKGSAATDENFSINTYPAYFSRLRGNYRYVILLKDKKNANRLHDLIAKLPKEYIMHPNIKIDINPLTTT